MYKEPKCEHGHRRGLCHECKALGKGGSELCEHKRARRMCRECGGKDICQHNRHRHECSLCFPRGAYRLYKRNANDHSREFFITLEEFCAMIKRTCTFCGRTPEAANGMGMDRTDNTLGYTTENCTPCCYLCNWMKNRFSVAEFLTHAKRVVDFQKENIK